MGNPKIEAGQKWLTRGGMIMPITEILTDNGAFSVRSNDMFWMENGKYWSDDLEHSKDLITQIK